MWREGVEIVPYAGTQVGQFDVVRPADYDQAFDAGAADFTVDESVCLEICQCLPYLNRAGYGFIGRTTLSPSYQYSPSAGMFHHGVSAFCKLDKRLVGQNVGMSMANAD